MVDEEAERAREREDLVKRLRSRGSITSEAVADAFRRVPRHAFVPHGERARAYEDRPLSIGEGQTISAPHMVAIMVEALDLEPGHRVYEVGGGSGYHAAVAAELVGPDGAVFTVERVPELARRARRTLAELGYGDRVRVFEGDGSRGLADHAPYDRSWVAAAAPEVPPPLLEQLARPGVLLAPVGSRSSQDLVRVEKGPDGRIHRTTITSVRFVPMLGRHGF